MTKATCLPAADTRPTPMPLTIFGAGKMGGAILSGALRAGWPASQLRVVEPHPSQALRDLAMREGIALNEISRAKARLLVLAIKPQMLDSAATHLAEQTDENTVVVSIMAGKSIADLKARVPGLRKIVRAMPNTPAAIGRGMTGAYAGQALNAHEKEQVARVLTTTGQVEWVANETLIDAVTALSGSGPAYVFYLVEAMAKAGEALGLPADLALRLARGTVEGAGELLFQAQAQAPASLRQNVTSPGGTTAAALEVLMAEDGLAPLMAKAITAARDRARELAG